MINESTVMSIFSWLADHPIIFGTFIFLVALIESLAIIGIVVPGVVLMLIIGAYLASEQFSFFYAVLLAIAGAVAGDGISYYLGYLYKDTLSSIWPISRYPETFKKGIRFFKRHGNKSVILGRFIGPLRPLIPAIAGMFQMPRYQFFISNFLSAIVWAPLVLLPGYLIGLSFDYASEIAGRLLLLVISIAVILWVTFWLIKFCYRFFIPQFDASLATILAWSQKHPISGKLPGILLDNKYSDQNIFSLLITLFLILCGLFFFVPAYLNIFNNTYEIDILLKNILLTFNSPASNQFILNVLNLIDLKWLIFLSTAITLLLVWKKYYVLFRYFIFTLTLTSLLQMVLVKHLNIDHNLNLLTVNIYLFLTLVLTLNSSTPRKILFYGVCYTLIATVLLAQLYQGNSNVVPLVITAAFSMLWILILTTTYQHHADAVQLPSTFQNLIGIFFISIIITNIVIVPNSITITNSNPSTLIVSNSVWKNHLWKTLPSVHIGFIKKVDLPFNIQWTGSSENIIKQMMQLTDSKKIGWFLSRQPEISTILQSLNPQAKIDELAIYPNVHNGVYEQLRFTHFSKIDNGNNKNGEMQLLVLRLWQTNFKIRSFNPEQQHLLWHGTITEMVIENRIGMKFLRNQLIKEKNIEQLLSKFEQYNNDVLLKKNNSGLKVLLVSGK